MKLTLNQSSTKVGLKVQAWDAFWDAASVHTIFCHRKIPYRQKRAEIN